MANSPRILQQRVNRDGQLRLVRKTAYDLSEAVIERGVPVTILGPQDADYLVFYCSLALKASGDDKIYGVGKKRSYTDGFTTVQMYKK